MESEIILEKLDEIKNLLKSQEKLLCFNEAAKYLNLSKSHLYKLTCSNRIKHFKPNGKKIYFLPSDLNNWLLRNPVRTINQLDQAAADYVTNSKWEK